MNIYEIDFNAEKTLSRITQMLKGLDVMKTTINLEILQVRDWCINAYLAQIPKNLERELVINVGKLSRGLVVSSRGIFKVLNVDF